MITKDINLYESGSGGEMSIVSNDLLLGESLLQQVYLACFGGNVESITRGDEITSELRYDYWANSIFNKDNFKKQFNSVTEKTLQEIILNSAGRLKLIQSINEDLSYLSNLINYTIDVQLISTNNIRIIINFTKKSNLEDKTLQLVYDNSKNELIIEKII